MLKLQKFKNLRSKPHLLPQCQTPPRHENLEEIKSFGDKISFGEVQAGGNPPFSVIARNIIFQEDAESIKETKAY